MMWPLFGACLTILGSGGAGFCICMERKQRLEQLALFSRAFALIAGEVSYSRSCLPEIFRETAQKMEDRASCPLKETFEMIGTRLEDGGGPDMETVWREEMQRCLAATKLRRQEKEQILSFSKAVWYPDGERQQTAVLSFVESMEQAFLGAKQTEREANRITMALCLAAGCLTAILLV